MVRRTLVAGLAAAALIATPLVASAATSPAVTGTPAVAAVALAGSASADPPTGTSTGTTGAATGTTGKTATKPAKPKHHPLRWVRAEIRFDRVLHAQWTTKDKAGTYVTHDAIHGTVDPSATAVSVTVTAADNVKQTYTMDSKTKVWKVVEVDGKKRVEKATPAAVTPGSEVIVQGTGGSAPYTATRILVQLKK